MSNAAIVWLVLITFLTGFAVGYIAGRSGPTDDHRGHPYDLEP